MTLTTYDEELCKEIEPNVSTTKERVEALKILRDEGIPTVVWLTPILPFINDTEGNIIGILNYCKEAKVFGIICFGMGVTLREGNREYFYSHLDKKFPKLKERYIREYGNNYVVNSVNNKKLMGGFHEFCERNGIVHDNDAIFNYLNLFEGKDISKQLSFFDEVWLRILSSKLLKAKEQMKGQEEKKESVLGAIKKYQAEDKEKPKESKEKPKETER